MARVVSGATYAATDRMWTDREIRDFVARMVSGATYGAIYLWKAECFWKITILWSGGVSGETGDVAYGR